MRIVTLSRWKVTCISRNLHLLIVDLGRRTCGSCHSFENNDHNLTLRRMITSCTNCQSWEKNYHLYIMWANCMSLMEYHLSVRTVTLVTRTATTDLWKLSPLWEELPILTCENCHPCEKNCHYLPGRTVILVRRTATTYLWELSVRTVILVRRTATTYLGELSSLWEELPPLTCENCHPCEKNCHYLPVRTVILVEKNGHHWPVRTVASSWSSCPNCLFVFRLLP